jgi:F420-non-reducing hydrogenase iron-sulfur subunit
MSDNDHFEPQIIAFACHHCAYAAADLAGALRLEYPTSLKVMELPCSGRVDVLHVLHAFDGGRLTGGRLSLPGW